MSSPSDETVSVRATAPGMGGIAVIEVIGPHALELVRRFVPTTRPGQLAHGRIIDEVLIHAVARPLTDEPTVEISCHGGTEPARAVLAALGVREVDYAWVFDRAVRARRFDRTRAEARLLLPHALTLRAATMLADQATGALARAVRRARSPEPLLETARLGCALVTPRRVAIVGRPNVGKSTLFNALVERDRAFVSATPGSTRDPVEQMIAINGMPLLLIDTAGLATHTGLLEQLSMERTRQELERADLRLLVRDTTPPTPEDIAFLERSHPPLYCVRSKADLPPAPAKREPAVCVPSGLGIASLRRAILRELDLQGQLRRGAPVVFTQRQRSVLETAAPDWKDQLLWGS